MNNILINLQVDILALDTPLEVFTAEVLRLCDEALRELQRVSHAARNWLCEKIREIRERAWDEIVRRGSPFIAEANNRLLELQQQWTGLTHEQRDTTLRSTIEGIKIALLVVVSGLSLATIGVGIGLTVNGSNHLINVLIGEIVPTALVIPITGACVGGYTGALGGMLIGGIASTITAASMVATAPITVPTAAAAIAGGLASVAIGSLGFYTSRRAIQNLMQ